DRTLRSSELVPDGGFEGGGSYDAVGTHSTSRTETKGPGKVLHLSADGRGDNRGNFIRWYLTELEPFFEYDVSFRARWIRGSNLLITRAEGNGIARAHELALPKTFGTPGEANTVHRASARASIGTPQQHPICPSAGEPTRIRVEISSRIALKEVKLAHRRKSEEEFRFTAMRASARLGYAGRFAEWIGEIPPTPDGTVEWYVLAIDGSGKETTYPEAAPDHLARYVVGLRPHSKFPTLTVLVGDDDWNEMSARHRMSNRLTRGTLIYGDERIIHDVGVRRRGSPWTRGRHNWRVHLGSQTIDGRHRLTIDGQRGAALAAGERLVFWLSEQLGVPNPRTQFVYFRLPGREEGVFEDVEKVDRTFLKRHFPSKKEESARDVLPALHKLDHHFEFVDSGRKNTNAYLRYSTDDPEDYRWSFVSRSEVGTNDFSELIALTKTFSDNQDSEDFVKEILAQADIEEWSRSLAARAFVDDWDTFGRRMGKNAFLYQSPHDALWRLIPWDCDLAWRNPRTELVGRGFPSVNRLMAQPRFRRRYHSHLAYLAKLCQAGGTFETALGDLQKIGASTGRYRDFARRRVRHLEARIPSARLEIVSVASRVDGSGNTVWDLEGTAPPIVDRLEFDGATRDLTFHDVNTFEVTIDPGSGPDSNSPDRVRVRALDLGNHELAHAEISLRKQGPFTWIDDEPESSDPVPVTRVPTPSPTRERWSPAPALPFELNPEWRPHRSIEEREQWLVIIGLAALATSSLGLYLFLRSARRRRRERAKQARRHESSLNVLTAQATRDILRLSASFDRANAALGRLSRLPDEDIPTLLQALDDARVTPFGSLEERDGIVVAEASRGGGSRVRDVAEYLLRRRLGAPTQPHPNRDDWTRHWEEISGQAGRP
ncbi:MAG: CotH kinase family protein, partial [Planctomycetota bacterium]